VPRIPVPELGRRAGLLAARALGEPSAALDVIGVTGTDGKTSCTHFIAQALTAGGVPTGIIGTLGSGPCGQLRPGTHTTPDAVQLQHQLAELRAAGMLTVAMEVSSHALDQSRVEAVDFDIALLTQVGRDHLDYHGSQAAYAAAKQRLFRHPGLRAAVLNLDDAHGHQWALELADRLPCVLYGSDPRVLLADRVPEAGYLVATQVRADGSGWQVRLAGDWGDACFHSALPGRFNVTNLLACAAVLLQQGFELADVVRWLEQVQPVPGRMETFGGGPDTPLVVVDYAHTPGALATVLQALRPHTRGRLWCLFGAGGDRDRGKRPLMGAAAERWADQVVLTDDNPRTEDPETIIAEIRAGMQRPDTAWVVRPRGAAIDRVLAAARPGDTVLVAGKGHETEQIVGDRRLPFSDRLQVRNRLVRDGR